MKLAICNETFLDWPHERAMAFAAECGYTGLEIAPFTLGDNGPATDVRAISPAIRQQTRALADAAGLEIIGLHWLLAKTEGLHLTRPDPLIGSRTTEYLVALAQLCHDLGGRLMVLGSPQQRNRPAGVETQAALEQAARVIGAAMPHMEALDVTLAVEPLGPAEGNFLNTAAEAVELIERVGSTHCRLHLDCKAMSTESVPIPELIRRHRQLLCHFHANDPNRQGPGFGELEFEPILSALGEIGYQGWNSVEVFDYTPGVERLARESATYLRQCVQALLRS